MAWARSYPDESDTWFQALLATSGEDYFAAGNAAHLGTRLGACAPMVSRLGPEGAVKWHAVYRPSVPFEQLTDATAAEKDLLLASFEAMGGQRTAVVTRIDGDGNVAWSHAYRVPGCNTLPARIQLEASGEITVAGAIEPHRGSAVDSGPRDRDVWVMRLSGDGEVRWHRTYDSDTASGVTCNEAATGLAPDGAGGLFVAAVRELPATPGYHIWVLRLDGTGAATDTMPLGQAVLPGYPNNHQATAIVATGPDRFALCGFSNHTRNGSFGVLVVEADIKANACLTQRVYDISPGADFAYDLARTPHGELVVVGSCAAGKTGRDGLVLKLAPGGGVSFARAFGGRAADGLTAVSITTLAGEVPERGDYRIEAAGFTESFPEVPRPTVSLPPFTTAQAGFVRHAMAMSLDRHGNTDPAHDASCLIRTLDQVVHDDPKWSCHCNTDVVTTDPPISQEKREIAREDGERRSILLCDEL